MVLHLLNVITVTSLVHLTEGEGMGEKGGTNG
jgi:hypothetical protein